MKPMSIGATLIVTAVLSAVLWIASAETSSGRTATRSAVPSGVPLVAGNPQGDVTVLEFFDYNCSYCRKMAPRLGELLGEDAGLRLVYKEFPVLGPGSVFAAKAALAAQKQGRYQAFHEALMQASGPLTQAEVLEIAQSMGLDTERLEADMKDPAIEEAIERNFALAQDLGIFATPSFVIDGQIHRGAADLDTLRGLIRQARREAKGNAAK